MKEKWKTPAGTAFLAAMTCGSVAHLFGLVNAMHNYDDIAVHPQGSGTGTISGRWFLDLLGGLFEYFGGNYNLTVLNGLIFLFLLAVSAGILCRVLRIGSREIAALLGMLFVVFPVVTSTMLFRYTTIHYGIAVLLSVTAGLTIEKRYWGVAVTAVLICLALGIYQAYLPLTIGMFVLTLLREALTGETGGLTLVKKGLRDCGAILLGVAAYLLVTKLVLAVSRQTLLNYQGISSMGQIDPKTLLYFVKEAMVYCITFVGTNYCGLADSRLICLAYAGLCLLSLGMGIVLLIQRGAKLFPDWMLTCALVGVFPLAVNFIVVMCPQSNIYTLMQYGFVLIGFVPLVLLDSLMRIPAGNKRCANVLKKCVLALSAVLVSGYIYSANVNYTAQYYASRQAENFMNSLMTQARMTEGFTADKKWALVGNVKDPLYFAGWNDVQRIGGNADMLSLVNSYSRCRWFERYMGCRVPELDEAGVRAIAATEEVLAMPCWPDEGSIQVIGDVLVIKFQDIG